MNEAERAHWLARRAGILTSSQMRDALDFRKDGKPGAGRVNLVKEKLAERLTGLSVRHYVSPEMLHGLEFEDEARSMYESETGNIVALPIVELMPYIHPTITELGASHDGFVGHDGMVEIKCPTTSTHVGYLRGKVVPEDYKPQMIVEMACCRRQWCDFVSYDPRIKIERLRLFVVRYVPTPEEITVTLAGAEAFLKDVDNAFDELVSA